ncbi:MAG: ferritin [Candidatus Bathyarchaeia archaeon]|jgi:ferritin
MINERVERVINGQINKEFYSYYLYLAMAAHFESANLKGFAHWMRMQAGEESGHAMKLYDYLLERGGKIVLEKLDAPPSNWNSHKNVFEDAYQHEQKVTKAITELFELAKSEKDHATEVFLQWFIKEQVEEEASAFATLQRLELLGSDGGAIFMLDVELGKRAQSNG